MGERLQVSIPHDWSPRAYQKGVWRAMDQGGRRGVCVWHRRAGKDLTGLHRTVLESQRRRANYYHVLPTYNQGRKVIWQGKDSTGRPFLDAWPSDLIKGRPNNTEMRIELLNGSTWQVIGGDQIDRIVGVNLGGVLFSEWSLTNPLAYEYMRPILRENNAWALFLFTPRGKNHGYDLYRMAQANPEWFCELLTVDDTGVVSADDIERDRSEGMSDELIRQEYYCDFTAGIVGSYYGRYIAAAQEAGRILELPFDPVHRVHTAWDLGYDDSNAIIFFQVVGSWINVINYIEHHGEGLPYYAKRLRDMESDYGYLYGRHFAPHDIEQHEIGTGRTRKAIAADLGINFITIPRISGQAEGIEAVRSVLPRCRIDDGKCSKLVSALENYRQEYDEERKKFIDRPLHDWSSHGAKAFESLSFGVDLIGVDSGSSKAAWAAARARNRPPSSRAR